MRRRQTRAPVCEASLTGDVSLPGGEVFAPGTWTVDSDDDGLYLPGSPPGILISADGRWLLRNRANIDVADGAGFGARITLNGTANRVVIGHGATNPFGRVTVTAERELVLSAGDVVYWSYYTTAAGTLYGGSVQTEVCVRYVGPN